RRARARARRRRPVPALRARADGRRVPVRAVVLRPDVEGRRACARREPDSGGAAHGRRPRCRAASRDDGVVAVRAAAGRRAVRADRPADGARAVKLYDAARCPFCARVRIALAEKGFDYETVEIDLGNRPDWIYELNPTGKVPVLDDGFVLPESAVIMEY